jgi:hypothetical protein
MDGAAGPDPQARVAFGVDELVVGDFDRHALLVVSAVQPETVRIELEPPRHRRAVVGLP